MIMLWRRGLEKLVLGIGNKSWLYTNAAGLWIGITLVLIIFYRN